MSKPTSPRNATPPRKAQRQNAIHDTALGWCALGASPIPVRLDGSKAPAVPWKRYETEQASAGLDSLTAGEHAEFDRLNTAYMAKHGFPFIIAVRDHDKPGIMAAMRRRIQNDTATERREAERQVARIGALRLEQMLGDN